MDTSLSQEQIERLFAHTDWLRALARRLVRDASAAEDLVQETWLAALKAPPDDTLPVRPWLAGVARRLALMQFRGDSRRAAREARVARAEGLPSTAELIAELDLQRDLSKLVANLAEPVRTTVLLRYQEGLSSAEIARRQGVPAGTVRWRLKRGIDQLRVELDERFGGRTSWLGALAAFARVQPSASVLGANAVGSSTGMWALLMVFAASVVGFLTLGPGGACRAAPQPEGVAGALTLDASGAPRTSGLGARLELTAPSARAASSATAPGGLPAPSGPSAPWRLQAIDGESEAPLSNTEWVALAHDSPRARVEHGRTDAQGSFELPSEFERADVFLARAAAFIARFDDVRPAPLDDGAAPEVVRLVLQPGGALRGRVVVDGRAPTEPLLLELDSDRHLWDGRPMPDEVAQHLGNGRRARASTDRDGRFEFTGLAPDWSGVLWVPPSHRVVAERTGAYSDESVYLTAAASDVLVTLESRGLVTGRIIDDEGAAVVGAPIKIFVPGLASPIVVASERDGVFRAKIGAARAIVVEVTPPDQGAPTQARFDAVADDGRLGDLVVPVARGPAPPSWALEVTVVDREAAAVGGMYLRLTAEAALFEHGSALGCVPPAMLLGPTPKQILFAVYAVGADGKVSVPALAPGNVVDCTLEDATGRALVQRRLSTSGDPAALTARMVFDEELRALSVRVRDEGGELLLGGVVKLGQPGRTGLYRRMGLDGFTVFEGVASGTSTVEVEAVKRGYVSTRWPQVPMPNVGETLELVLPRALDLVLVLSDPMGAAVVDAALEAEWPGQAPRRAKHLGGGRYRLDDAPAGESELVIRIGDTTLRRPLIAQQSGELHLQLDSLAR
ncbi:MAG: sigma-70 family RNA polymerase sigma factor [Planctomycetota bacterium]